MNFQCLETRAILNWQQQHNEATAMFIKELNQSADHYVLKGSAALKTCYGLDRVPENLDFDGFQDSFIERIESFCKKHHYEYDMIVDSNTSKWCCLLCEDESRQFSVRVSNSRTKMQKSLVQRVDGILTYSIGELCTMKVSTFQTRDNLRDIYDLCFIANNFYDQLPPPILSQLRNAVEYKGIEYFYYILRTRNDEQINKHTLKKDFFQMTERLGLLYDQREIES